MARARSAATYRSFPLSFEPNQGQAARPVEYLAHGKGYALLLTSNAAWLALRQPQQQPRAAVLKDYSLLPASFEKLSTSYSGGSSALEVEQGVESRASLMKIELVGTSADARILGIEEIPGTSNYFLGNRPHQWRTRIPNYAKVEYQHVYPGVDLIYYGSQGQLECDFVVQPGADPGAIRLQIDGASSMKVDERGDLELGVAGGAVRFEHPRVYQRRGDVQQPVAGKFALEADNEIGFKVGAYDRRSPLVIDPVVVYATYLGGTSANLAEAVAVDSSGNAYLTGQTLSVNFPTANPIQRALVAGSDAFVAKFNPQGSTLVYSTYLGGTLADNATSIAVDDSGNAYVTGSTLSADFPLKNAIQTTCLGCAAGLADVFVAKISAGGSALVYSTFLGGTKGNTPGAIAADSSGNAYVIGTTTSTDFPVASAIQGGLKGSSDAFVTKFNDTGSQLVYSTFLGGANADDGRWIAVDSAGNAYLTGTTSSTDFPVVTPAIQGSCRGCPTGKSPYVAKINAAGSALVYSTFLGGTSGSDATQGIAVDGAGNAYVTGQVVSKDFPLANALQGALKGASDAFVTKINAAGSSLLYSTYLGGSNAENAVQGGIAADEFGNAYVTGDTKSPDFPIANQVQRSLLGADDAFVAVLNSTGSALFFSTYLGGTASDEGRGIAVDTSGNAYVAGSTNSLNFPITSGVFQTSCNTCGGAVTDAFLAKLSAPMFSIGAASGSSTSATVTAGQTATYNLELVSSGNFSGTVSLACSGTVPAGTCSVSPASVAPTGSGSTSFTASVTTMTRGAAYLRLPPAPLWPSPLARSPLTWLFCLLALAILAGCAVLPRRRVAPALVLVLILAGISVSCGGGGSSGGPPPPPGTTAGTYSLTVSGTSGNFSNSTPLTLKVN
ncbi:MAG TPA: SBBP repeat-containing protein [Terriglobia bacterium]|nr:SBBP repeat-containing protein [Terriglobia bacterium]